MDVEARKRSLRYFFAKIVEPLGYKFTPDEELADFLLEQETHLEDGARKSVLPMPGTNAEPRREHEDRLPLHSVPSGPLRLHETLLVRSVCAQRRDRP